MQWLVEGSCVFNVEHVRHFLASGYDPNKRSPTIGKTPLHWAAAYGNAKAVEALLEFGADVDIADNHGGSTALHCAVNNFRKNIVRVLLAAGADLNLGNKEGYTPLHGRNSGQHVGHSYARRGRRGRRRADIERALRWIHASPRRRRPRTLGGFVSAHA